MRQDVVEIDPANGKIAGTYGAPPGYTKDWRITRLDKVGARSPCATRASA